MLAPVLPFRRRLAPRDWTDQDKAEFYRVIDVLGRAGIPLELETGLTDEDEPWAVFCMADAGDPVVHIARLGAHYILAATTLAEPLRGADLRSLVRVALQDVPAAIMPGSSQGGLALHPAAMLLVLVATCWFQAAHATEPAPEIAAQLLGMAPEPEDEAAGAPPQLAVGPEGEAQEQGGEAAALRFQHSLTVAVALLTVSGDVGDLIPPTIEASAADLAAPRDEAGPAQGAAQGTEEPVTASRPAGDAGSVLVTDFTPMPEEAPPSASPMAPVAEQAEDATLAPVMSAGKAAATAGDAILPGANGVLVWHADGVLVQPVETGVLAADWIATAADGGGQAIALPADTEAAKAALVQALGHLDAYQSWSLVQTGRTVTPLADLSPELSQKFAALIVSDTASKPMTPAVAPDLGGAPIPSTPIDSPSLVSLVSLGGPAGMREQKVSIDAALAQLHQFTTSTPDHLTILSGKSLVLVDPTVLKGGQPHAYTSFTMSDGSELAWIYPVGVAGTPWTL